MAKKNQSNIQTKVMPEQDTEDIRLRHEHFLKSINNLPGVVLRYEMKKDESDRIVFISEQCEVIWEFTKDEILNNMSLLWQIIHPEDVERLEQSLIASAADQSKWELEWRVVTRSGQLKWLKGIGEPDKDADGVLWDMFITDITEEHLLQEKIKQKSTLLQRTEEIANIGSWEIDVESNTIYWSDQIFNIFGIPVEEYPPSIDIQRNFFLGNGWEIYDTSFQESIRTGKETTVQATIKDFKGKTKNIISRAFPLKNEMGEVVKLIGSIQDITEQTEVENRLNDSQVMFRNITNNIPGLVLRYQQNPDGSDQLLFLSKGVEELFELDVEEARRDVSLMWKRIHPVDLEEYRSSLQESAIDMSFWEKEFRIIMPDGRVKWLNGRGKPFKKDDGTIVWDSIALDITDKKHDNDRLKKLKEQLDLAIETAQLGVWSYDMNTREQSWNDQMLIIYGLSRAQYEKDSNQWLRFIHPDDIAGLNQAFKKLRKGKEIGKLNFRIKRADGSVRYINSYISGVSRDGKIVELLGVNADVTNFKVIEEELTEAKNKAEASSKALKAKNDELVKANQELDNFVYRVSHDLRSPITSAIGLSELSLVNTDIDKVHYYDELRIQTLKKLDRFINEILNYSRNSRMPVKAQYINFEKLIDTIIAEYSSNIEKDSIKIEKSFDCENAAYGDHLRINTILDNLISNAFKFVNTYKDESFIKISVKVSPQYIFISVEDNGIGIKKDQQSKIFDMFYRASNVGQGSGIGLYILKESLEKISGKLELESEYGEGAKFSIRIPNSKNGQ